MLLLLDFQHVAIIERPPNNVRLLVRALDRLGALEGGPELAKVLQLDEVPDVRQRGLDEC